MRNSTATGMSTAKDALDLRGTVGFFVSMESVTGLHKENNEFPYFSVPLQVISDGVVRPRR
jgi:hypothetical protein